MTLPSGLPTRQMEISRWLDGDRVELYQGVVPSGIMGSVRMDGRSSLDIKFDRPVTALGGIAYSVVNVSLREREEGC